MCNLQALNSVHTENSSQETAGLKDIFLALTLTFIYALTCH